MALDAFRLNAYFFASRSNTQSGVPPSFWTSPPNTPMGLTLWDQSRKEWIFGIQHGSSKNWTTLCQEQFQGQTHSSALGVWERAEACSSRPYSKGTEGWDVNGVGLKKEKSWLTLEVRAIWQWQLSLHSLPRSIHLIIKWVKPTKIRQSQERKN